MKKLITTILLLLFLFPAIVSAQEMTAKEIVQKANDILFQETAFAKTKMIINTTSGQKRELFFDSWIKDRGGKSLIRYTAPRRIKDQAMLMLNNADDIWSYFPRTNRVRKLASHAKKQKMQGSDFSYEDMGSGDSFMNDYTHRKLGEGEKEGKDCYQIELTKNENIDSNYSRLILWIDKEQYVIWVIEYYDEKEPDRLVKTLIQSDLKIIDGLPTPMKMVMHNHLDNSSTAQELIEIKFNIEINDNMFTERGLKK
ncbi:MAG: outer membrane lipoprotein-sorting protein [bacterium]|nr:outer membrane lipoprotein-sorting protein [bacterium]